MDKYTKELKINAELQKLELLEPVIFEGNLGWLVREKKRVGRELEEISVRDVLSGKDNQPIIEVYAYKVIPENLWRCLKCGALIESNKEEKPPLECYEKQGGCGRKGPFEQVTKSINPDLWKIPTWKDIPPEKLDMKAVFENTIELIKKLLIFQKEIEYKMYSLWIFSTWKLEVWDTVGFPAFIGMPDSGKSRALRIMHELAYRASKSAGVTQAAIPRLCHYHNVTLLIDEAHNKLNPKTESGSKLLDFVKDSYKRGSVYIVSDNNDQQKLVVTRNFGFKAFAGEKTFNPALLTRSFVFWMDKAEPEIAKLSYVEEELSRIRTALLNYRYKTDDPPDLGNDFELKGRVREIFESIIATGMHIGISVEDIIEFAKNRSKEEFEAIKDSVEYEILSIINEGQDFPFSESEIDRINTDTILTKLKWDAEDGKEVRKNKQKLGYILKNLGLKTKRTSEGRFLYYAENEDRLNQLYRRFRLI